MAAEKCRLKLLLAFAIFLVFPLLVFPLQRGKTSAIIREINKKGPYIGLITVYAPEENAFFASGAFKNASKYPYVDLSGRRFRVGTIEGKNVIYVKCGVGLTRTIGEVNVILKNIRGVRLALFYKNQPTAETSYRTTAFIDLGVPTACFHKPQVNAAAATQQMLDRFNIKGLIHFGISGNINNSLSIGDVTIPKEFANTGLWDWLKPKATIPSNDIAQLDFENYNVPKEGNNSLGCIGYSPEEFYSEEGETNNVEERLWFQVSQNWLQLATNLEGMELEQCVNSSLCLENKPKVVVGLKGSTANTFIDNAAYRDFLSQTFGVSSADMESTAVVMTSLSNGFPVLVVRGLSDLAGAQEGANSVRLFGSLAASNVANVVIQFVKLLPNVVNRLILSNVATE